MDAAPSPGSERLRVLDAGRTDASFFQLEALTRIKERRARVLVFASGPPQSGYPARR